jgi:hypothetical protein
VIVVAVVGRFSARTRPRPVLNKDLNGTSGVSPLFVGVSAPAVTIRKVRVLATGLSERQADGLCDPQKRQDMPLILGGIRQLVKFRVRR